MRGRGTELCCKKRNVISLAAAPLGGGGGGTLQIIRSLSLLYFSMKFHIMID